MVTAQKRDSTLQETAISLSVLSADDIEKRDWGSMVNGFTRCLFMTRRCEFP